MKLHDFDWSPAGGDINQDESAGAGFFCLLGI